MGAREAGNERAAEWAREAGGGHGTFAQAAGHGEVVVNATAGVASLEALAAAGADRLAGKVLIDVANPLDFSHGMPPTLAFCNDQSLGERIQASFPDTRVVKTLNTVNADAMVDPTRVPGSHTMFLCGNDDGAKAEVAELLASFGWPPDDVMDLGDISGARAMEMYLPLWLRIAAPRGAWHFNVKVVFGS